MFPVSSYASLHGFTFLLGDSPSFPLSYGGPVARVPPYAPPPDRWKSLDCAGTGRRW